MSLLRPSGLIFNTNSNKLLNFYSNMHTGQGYIKNFRNTDVFCGKYAFLAWFGLKNDKLVGLQ